MTGQLAFDWAAAEPKPRRQTVGTPYHPGPQNDLRGQRLRTSRIVTIPIRGEYL